MFGRKIIEIETGDSGRTKYLKDLNDGI